MSKYPFRPRKRLAQLRADLERRLQVVLFTGFFAAEIAASVALVHIASLNPVYSWYGNAWTYGMGHFIMSLLVLLAITAVWWVMGNLAAWEAICRTRQRHRMLFRGALAGLGIDLAASLLSWSYTASFALPLSMVSWLLLRAGLWIAVYSAVGMSFLLFFRLNLKSRRVRTASR